MANRRWHPRKKYIKSQECDPDHYKVLLQPHNSPSKMSPPTSLDQENFNTDLEKELLLSTSYRERMDSNVKSALNEDHLKLCVGQEHGSQRSSTRVLILSRGFKYMFTLLVAFLSTNGFWAIFGPELFDHNSLFTWVRKGDCDVYRSGLHHYHHHDHDGPSPHGSPVLGSGNSHPPCSPPHGPLSHPLPPPPRRRGGPGRIQECFDLIPGNTLQIQTPLDWFGQGIEIAPSFAGLSVTFVWDGEVGPPVCSAPGFPHPPHPPHSPYPRINWKDGTSSNDGSGASSEKCIKERGEVIFEIDIPSSAEWKIVNITSHELKICLMRRIDSTGIDIFNASGIPPSDARTDAAFNQIASSFNTTIHLPSHYARAPVRNGYFL